MKRFNFPFVEGDIVTLYKDYQQEKEPLGTAKLVSFHRPGRTFILEETMPESDQEVYSFQEWFVEVDGQVLPQPKKIRFLETIGISTSKDDDMPDDESSKLPVDSFLTIEVINEDGEIEVLRTF